MASEKTGEEQLKAVWFAAGTAAFMACIERATVVSLFAHWRVWAFLALNLLLLAILFTSKFQIPSNEIEQEEEYTNAKSNIKKKGQECKKKEVQECGLVAPSNDSGECLELPKSGEHTEHETKIVEDDGSKQEAQEQLSQEELNKKVEAFIAMFRQHLASDAKGVNRYRSGRSSSAGFVTPNQLNSPSRASFSL